MDPNGQAVSATDTLTRYLDAIVEQLKALNSAMNAQTPTDPYQEKVIVAFDSTNPIYIFHEQMRIHSAVFYTDTAGVYVFKRGNDTAWIFRAGVNSPVSIIGGSDQETVLTAGLPITVTGPASNWSMQMWGIPGNPGGQQNPH